MGNAAVPIHLELTRRVYAFGCIAPPAGWGEGDGASVTRWSMTCPRGQHSPSLQPESGRP